MRYTGIPRHIRKQLIADKKQNEAIQVRKLNKPFPAMTSGDEVTDFVYAKEFPLTVYIDNSNKATVNEMKHFISVVDKIVSKQQKND